MKKTPVIETERTSLEILSPIDAKLMLEYYLENDEHLIHWEPERNENFFTLLNWKKLLQKNLELYYSGSALRFSALNKNRTKVIGTCNFSNIVYGAFQACNLGYSIAKPLQGTGLMYEIISAGIKYMFDEMPIHRIMANYIPGNSRSGALLKRLNFEQEGLAKKYLKIDGKWQDHVLTSIINSNSKFS